MEPVWSKEKAQNWYASQPWPCGFNYIPADAISYTEMWMDYNFNPEQIDEELKLAENVGFNCTRVVLPFIVWENDHDGFMRRFNQFLEICANRGIKVMPCLFDDCAFGVYTNPVYGKQPDVIEGWYANGWTPSPGHDMVRDSSTWPRLEKYVQDILSAHKSDSRIWAWDLYNEPTNGIIIGPLFLPLGNVTIPLLKEVFKWARRIAPSQPLTVAKFIQNEELNELCLGQSDIITFHNYESPVKIEQEIQELKRLGRPVICTEWMQRGVAEPADCLPIFQREKVGALHWGLVNGKTQTHLFGGCLPGTPQPEIWLHDLFKKDHTPYCEQEIHVFQKWINDSCV